MIRLLTFLLPVALLIGCAGTTARQEILLPRAEATWVHDVRPFVIYALEQEDPANGDTFFGIARFDELQRFINEMDNGFINKDRVTIARAGWSKLKPLAKLGVRFKLEHSRISEISAISVRESIRLFDLSMTKLAQRTGR